ncbi:response regulator [Desulfitobacterium sp. Sab5]|uniref:response regulator n=1 Tax=Desulfitobacterium nosdiversum TaxID=3375356 RepID=UPI003CED5FDD
MTIRLMLVDDHEIVRMGLRAALSDVQDFEIVGEAGTAEECTVKTREVQPDIILMDVRLPKRSGIEACREVLAERPDIKVIMLTSYADEDAVVAAILAGAQGFVMKEVSSEALTKAIMTVSAGGTILDSVLTRSVLAKLQHNDTSKSPKEHLTERESEILILIGRGLTNKEIARRTYLSENTVRNYVSSILHKLGFKNRSQATAYALEQKHKEY